MDPRIYAQSLHTLPKPTRKTVNQPKNNQFHHLLHDEMSRTTELKVSKHAQQRMDVRGIEIPEEKWLTIQEKVKEAKQKGVTDSLVITDDATLVVSAKNDTVITVMNREEAQSQIFTNINGTIIID
ncbi:flagellar protein [Alkalihalobacillus sp. MEB130]|uniref:TIGR02530 family flagellar biosynthesis protein n=1 Tax=Alkalihalobacillus sp. MEB130 TaxID=2976704 RepID=UPI0028E04FCF|nr:TIGR02530 family flagellar biosynthesis protein [Alkalihalobacillus sp. MEB130]MDT8859021.1 flagellar protein [Alkalihalobacillus sp. MEB130]